MGKRSRGTDEGGDFILWVDSKGQSNKKYISGRDIGVHKWHNPKTGKSGETFGPARERNGFAIAGSIIGGAIMIGFQGVAIVFKALLGALED